MKTETESAARISWIPLIVELHHLFEIIYFQISVAPRLLQLITALPSAQFRFASDILNSTGSTQLPQKFERFSASADVLEHRASSKNFLNRSIPRLFIPPVERKKVSRSTYELTFAPENLDLLQIEVSTFPEELWSKKKVLDSFPADFFLPFLELALCGSSEASLGIPNQPAVSHYRTLLLSVPNVFPFSFY